MDGFWGLDWSPAGDIVYVSLESRNRDIWVKDADNKSSPRQLTFDAAADYYPTVSPNGHYIVFVSNRTGSPHLWRMNSDGSNLKQLTNKTEELFPQITPDGQWIIYSSRTERRPSLWKVSIEGGEPIRLTKQMAQWPALSPDGKWIACITKGDEIEEPLKLGIFSSTALSFSRTMEIPGGVVSPERTPVIRWSNERTVAYIATRNGISNIWAQPLYGGAARKLTDFTADRIFWFNWSRDGTRLAYARGAVKDKVVLIEGF
jgi:Tol biopolymer transport system component